MYKENIICTVIIVLIIIGNIITQKYTKTSVEETSATLTELREEITKEDKNKIEAELTMLLQQKSQNIIGYTKKYRINNKCNERRRRQNI